MTVCIVTFETPDRRSLWLERSIVGSNPTRGMDVCIVCIFCVQVAALR
jgi:hypothetical protein